MKERLVPAEPKHVAFRDDLMDSLERHQHLTPMEMLAVASQFVGNLIAIQDQASVSSDHAMEVVTMNIVTGNKAVCNSVLGEPMGEA